jgi:predicted methyltransferase
MPEGLMGPLMTLEVHRALRAAAQAGRTKVECSLDLGRSTTTVDLSDAGWSWRGETFAFPAICKERTIYYWVDGAFQPVAHFTTSLVKLVPTQFGPPTFEIDGIKMLPTAKVSPYADAQRKVDLIQPRGKVILDTCGGLGYFAAWCMKRHARQVLSYEISSDVMWLRSLNPWSPPPGAGLTLVHADISEAIASLPDRSVDAVLHDPPRFGIAGELYSQIFYEQLARVLNAHGKLFHYTGAPNKLTTGRNVPDEVAKRLRHSGFVTAFDADGVLAVKK